MTRKMIFEFLTNMRNNVLLFLLILGLSGCEFFALSFAPGKEPLENDSELANQAIKVFSETREITATFLNRFDVKEAVI